jgi:hypothetical protein
VSGNYFVTTLELREILIALYTFRSHLHSRVPLPSHPKPDHGTAAMGLSRLPILRYIASIFSAVCLGFGITYMLYPQTGFSLYGFSSAPSTASEWAIMERIMVLYGAKDVFIAIAIFASTWFGTRKSAGMILIAGGACAGVDGWVVKQEAGTNEWNHWGYGSVMVGLGAAMMGILG